MFCPLSWPQAGVPDDCRHPGHPAAPPEANHGRSARLQHRHLQPRVPEASHQGAAGVCYPDRPQPRSGSGSCSASASGMLRSEAEEEEEELLSRPSKPAAVYEYFTTTTAQTK